MYASVIQNTSLTMNDVVELSIPQLEYLLSGCEKNSKELEKASSGAKTLEGADAVQFLIDNEM